MILQLSRSNIKCICSLVLLLTGQGSFASNIYIPRRSSTTAATSIPITGDELAKVYLDAFASYSVFPPITDNFTIWEDASLTRPIEVVIGTVFTSIDTIDPGNSEFTASSRSMMYWKRNDCNQTTVHQVACSRNLDGGRGFKFLRADNSVGGPNTLLLHVPNIHNQVFTDRNQIDLQPDGDIIEQNQVTYKQTFDMRLYPYEYHELEVRYSSSFSSNVVALSQMPDIDAGMLHPSVPPGWTLEGISCEAGQTQEGRAMAKISGADIRFATFICKIAVSRTNPGWWLTSFLLFACLLAIAFLGSLGILSKYVAEARDDKDGARKAIYDGTRLEGTFAVGLLLVYVFQVEISPYGQPIEFWPRIPTSTMIYILGLVAIMAESGAGLISSLMFTRPLLAQGFVGGILRPYDIGQLPREGEVPEEDQPLVVNGTCDEDDHNGAAASSEDIGDDESPPEPAAVFSTDAATKGKIPRSRKCNQKMYNVLSVEEAIVINRFARNTFFFKVSLMFLVALTAIIILVLARSEFSDLVTSASQ